MSKCGVIVTGGKLEEAFAKKTIAKLRGKETCVIGVDRGAAFLHEQGIMPDYIVGDFDSLAREVVEYYKNETAVTIREFNPVKDATDTEIAVRLGMELDCESLVILGATGGRLDHLWANVQVLAIPFRAGVDAQILDAQNRIRLIGGRTCIRKVDAYGKYFSVFPLGGAVSGFSIQGAKYPLEDHELSFTDSLCVSNQIEEDEVVIDFQEGIVILMETKDREEDV